MYFRFVFLSFLTICLCDREFRLMDPESRLFLGISKSYFNIVPFHKSSLLRDLVPGDQSPGSVVIQIDNYLNPITNWENKFKSNHFITFSKYEFYNQKWKAEFIGRNLVVIKADTDENLCMTYDRFYKRFDLLPCNPFKHYKDQKYAITDYLGHWDNGYDSKWYKGRTGGAWGVCALCLPNGFGYEDNPVNGRASDAYY